jgi:arylsulfatase A-like enzyme
MGGADGASRAFRSYQGFEGEVTTTFAESVPWWPPRSSAAPGAPNVVLVLADDLGFSDLGCFGSEISTPNIDAIAAQGLRYTNFRVTPLCSPTRAALLTGLNAHAAGVGFPTQIDPGFPGYASELPDNQPTLAEILRGNGYSTLGVGKWHLCKEDDFSEAGDRHSWPLQRGFDQFYGFLEAMTSFHHPHRLYEGNSVVQVDQYPEDYYLTDDLTERAVRMVREVKAADPRKPFFLYFAHAAVHAPMHAKKADIERYRGVYDVGWDVIRAQRLRRQVELGVMPAGTTLPPRNDEPAQSVGPWDDLNEDEKTVFARYMAVYAAMVDNMDQSVGRLREVLTELGELENTIFIFTSDNGASRLTDHGRAVRGSGTTTDTGTTSYFGYLSRHPAGSPAIEEVVSNLDAIGGPTTWPHYPRGWAMACNTPFRLYKFSTLRGGQQAPFVISWPALMAEAGYGLRRQYAHVTDVLPTLVDLIGLDVPGQRNGKPASEPAGVSFAHTLSDEAARSLHIEQYTECAGNRGYYRDGWEAVTVRKLLTPFSEERWQLFDVERDPTQSVDLAAEHPERVRELVEAFDKAAWANQVYPLDEGSSVKFLQKPDTGRLECVTIRSGTPTLERHRSSRLIDGRSFRIVVDWAYRRGDEGVVVAHGDQAAGYVMYVEGDALHFEQNQFGRPCPLPPAPLAAESQQLVVHVSAPGGGRWDVEIVVDGVVATAGQRLAQLAGFLPFEGIDVGIDRRSPVSWTLYRRHGAFPFSGLLHAVTYFPGEESGDAPEQRLARARAAGLALQ